MVEVKDRLREPEWYSMTADERRHASLEMALEVLLLPNEIESNFSDLDMSVRAYLDSEVPRNRVMPMSVIKSTLACLAAVYLPSFVLRSVPPPSVAATPTDFVNSRDELLDGILGADYNVQAVSKAIERFYMARSNPETRRVSDADAIHFTTDELLSDPAFRIVIEEMLTTYPEFFTRPRPIDYSMNRSFAVLAKERQESCYATLTFRQALQVKGRQVFYGAVAGSVALIALIVGAMSSTSLGLISYAHAQSTKSSPPKTDFAPPLGLPMSVWVPMVVGFYAVLLLLLVTCGWAGFVSKRKNEKAADMTKSFATLALGVFLGKITTGVGS